jgi:hypothetical protein
MIKTGIVKKLSENAYVQLSRLDCSKTFDYLFIALPGSQGLAIYPSLCPLSLFYLTATSKGRPKVHGPLPMILWCVSFPKIEARNACV